jgi:hypothetical protein
VLRCHHFRDDAKAELIGHFPQKMQTRLAEPLEGIGGCSRLVGATAQEPSAPLSRRLSAVSQLVPVLDGAGTRNKCETATAKLGSGGGTAVPAMPC